MSNFIRQFFDGSYAPHGYCLLWQPELVWTHVIADAVIALSYFSIPLALITLVRRRRDIVFGWAFWLFALFILACGASHVMAIWTLWYGNYGIEAIVKVVTATASIATAIMLWPLIPKVIALPSPDALRAANAELAALVSERDAALAKMREESAQRERVELALVQSKKLEAVGQLTGGIAHDFNNLLQAVGGNLELICKRTEDTERVQRWANNASRAVSHGKAVTGQLLAFSRAQKLELNRVALAPLLEAMSDLMERSIGPLNRLEIEPVDRDMVVITDATQLELSILNLAINARDAMPEGGTVRITVTAQADETQDNAPGGGFIEIAVSDTGIGMDAATLDRALEPFFTTKSIGEGTGLGLSMVFGVVSQSGGRIAIESAPGKGTTVRLILPRSIPLHVPAAAVARTAANTAPPIEGREIEGREIVLIDDDDRVREPLADLFAELGARVVSAADGEAGLALIAASRPDLLVVDYAMPGMNGAEVATRARALYSDLPVLIITGYSESSKLEEITGRGISVLRKPFRGDALLNASIGLLNDPAVKA